MHQTIYQEFEKIIDKHKVSGRVLEVGAIPCELSLLASKKLAGCEKTGLNMEEESRFADFKIVKGNANDMNMFEAGTFDCVLCNATLEHDKFFWKSVLEMKRVLKTGGLMILGVPTFVESRLNTVNKIRLGKGPIGDFLENSTVCFKVHAAPGDYYRFSDQACREVLFDGFRDVKLTTLMMPPRTIGFGRKE